MKIEKAKKSEVQFALLISLTDFKTAIGGFETFQEEITNL